MAASIESNSESAEMKADRETVLKGIPASAGIARGKAKIILTPKHIDKMQDGNILVAEFTNPLFTPAILIASAVVTDKGGFLCHAAIISREMGIPCIVGTQKATKVLSDEEEVIVDGEKGKVSKCQT